MAEDCQQEANMEELKLGPIVYVSDDLERTKNNKNGARLQDASWPCNATRCGIWRAQHYLLIVRAPELENTCSARVAVS